MPERKGPEAGLQITLKKRAGLDVRFRGMNLEGDPGGIGPDEFQHLINMEWKADRMIVRPGQKKVNSAEAVTGKVMAMVSDTAYSGETSGDPGGDDDGGPFGGLGIYGFAQILVDDQISAISRYDPTAGSATFDTTPNAFIYPVLWRDEIYVINARNGAADDPVGIYALLPGTLGMPRLVFTIPPLNGDSIGFGSLAVGADDKLYVTMRDGQTTPTDTRTYSWDGQTLTLELTRPLRLDGYTHAFQESIVVEFESDSWYEMASDGTWASIGGLPGSPLDGFEVLASVNYEDKAYFLASADLGYYIFSWDGTAFALVRTLPSLGYDMVVFDGNLLYLMGEDIGSFDGVTWNDAVKTWATDSFEAMIELFGELYVLRYDEFDPTGGGMMRTQGGNVAGAYIDVADTDLFSFSKHLVVA